MTTYLRTSERGSYKRCRWQWFQAWVERVKPPVAGPALRFGDLIHKSLAAYYKPGTKRGPHPARTFNRLFIKEFNEAGRLGFRDEDGKWQDAGDLGRAMLNGYIEEWHEHDRRYRVVSSEQTFRWRIGSTVYVGTFDGVWEDLHDGCYIFPEHKTTGKMAKSWDHLEMDEQASAYWTFGPAWLAKMGIIEPDDLRRFKGIQYNFLKKALPDDRPQNADGERLNKDGSVSERQPGPLFCRPALVYRDEEHRRLTFQQIKDEIAEMEMVKRGELAALKNPGPLYMPNCLGCPVREMCQLHNAGADWEAFRDGAFIRWDPYADHLDPHSDVIA